MKKAFYCLALLVYINLFTVCLKVNAETHPQHKDLFFKADTLIKISLHFIKLKDYDKAENALKAAYKVVREIKEPYSREIVLFELSDKYLLINKTENAFKIAKIIEFPDVQSEAFAKISYKYAELGDYTLASKITKQIKDPFSKAKALYRIVNKLTDLELYDQAIKIAKETEDSKDVIKELVLVQILANRLHLVNLDLIVDQNLSNLSNPDGLYRRSRVLTEVADKYLDLCLYELPKKILARATLIATRIGQQSLRQDAFQKIEGLNNKISEFEKSLNVVKYKNK